MTFVEDRYQFEKDFFEELYELDKMDEEMKEAKQKKKTEKKSEEKAKRKRAPKKQKDDTTAVKQEGKPMGKKRKKGNDLEIHS